MQSNIYETSEIRESCNQVLDLFNHYTHILPVLLRAVWFPSTGQSVQTESGDYKVRMGYFIGCLSLYERTYAPEIIYAERVESMVLTTPECVMHTDNMLCTMSAKIRYCCVTPDRMIFSFDCGLQIRKQQITGDLVRRYNWPFSSTIINYLEPKMYVRVCKWPRW